MESPVFLYQATLRTLTKETKYRRKKNTSGTSAPAHFATNQSRQTVRVLLRKCRWVKPPLNLSRSVISTVRHSSNGEIKTRMGALFKAKEEAAPFIDRCWSLPMVKSDGQLDGQQEQWQRTIQVAASRRLLWCYVGNWKKRAFLPWESVYEPAFLETQERYQSGLGSFYFYFCIVCFYRYVLLVYSNDTRRAGELLGNGRSKPKSMV